MKTVTTPLTLEAASPWLESIFLHSFLTIVAGTAFYWHVSTPKVEKIEFEVTRPALPTAVPVAGVVQDPPKKLAPPVAKTILKPRSVMKPTESVFGISKRAHVDSRPRATPAAVAVVKVKIGNTLAKTPDVKKLIRDVEATPAVGTPGVEATVLPRLIRELKVPYPPDSKRRGVQGKVVFDLWLDTNGQVRRTTLIKTPSYELAKAAQTAIYQAQFTPARIGEKAVPIQIRYSYLFIIH